MDFLKTLITSVPMRKNITSLAISLVALAVTYVLQKIGITEASPVAMAIIAPLVNWIREAAKDNPRPLAADLRSTGTVNPNTAEQILDTLTEGLDDINTPQGAD